MSVNVIVCGADVNSDEYEAALKLKTIIMMFLMLEGCFQAKQIKLKMI